MTKKILDIEIVVCRFYEVSVEHLHSERKTSAVVLARQACMYFVRERTRLSFPEIGEHFGRDHTSVMRACAAAAARTDDLAMLVALLEQPVITCPHCAARAVLPPPSVGPNP